MPLIKTLRVPQHTCCRAGLVSTMLDFLHHTACRAVMGIFLAALPLLPGCAFKAAPDLPAPNSGNTGPDMIYLQGGTFLMGDNLGKPGERPLHTVALSPFYIDSCEVTVSQYAVFLEETGREKPAFWQPELDRPDDPVVGVTWYDASAFASWAGKRLPTEAEWEFAARGGVQETPFPWGDDPDNRHANFSSAGIAPAKRFEPNGYGIYDMTGNVWEWCSDWYDESYYQIRTADNPKGPVTGTFKVLRGGAWNSNEEQARTANRYYALPDSRSFHNGFRCVRSAP